MSKETRNLYEFGDFTLKAEERTLWHGEELVSIPPKVFDTLLLLVEKEGGVVSKSEMLDAIWADSFVEESNLSQNIYTLRQVLGKDPDGKSFIETVPKKGYRFAIPVRLISRSNAVVESSSLDDDPSFLLAKQTRTQIFTEEVIDSDVTEKRGNDPTFFKANRFAFASIIITLTVVIVGFFGFWILRNEKTGLVGAPVGKAQFKELTDTGDILSLAISPESKFIAYAVINPKNGNALRLKDIKLNEEVNLAISASIKPDFLTFSPDGNYLYFLNKKGRNQPADIYKITRFGGEAEKVAEDVSSEFSFSADGKRIAFVRLDSKSNQHLLTIRELESGKEMVVLKKEFPDGFSLVCAPAWSPTGDKIYAVSQKQRSWTSKIVSIDPETRKEEIIPTPGWMKHIVQMETTKNEGEIIVAARRNGTRPQIYRHSTLDSTTERVTNDVNNYYRMSVSDDGNSVVAINRITISNLLLLPNGKSEGAKQLTFGAIARDGRKGLDVTNDGKIVYASLASRNREVWSFDLNTNAKRQLTKHPKYGSRNPEISNDGRYIYYEASEDGSTNIKRMDIDGQNQTAVTSDRDSNDSFPAVSSDGATLYFIRQRKGNSEIWEKKLPDGELKKTKVPTGVTPGGFLRISPNGRFLAFQQIESASSASDGTENTMKIGIVALDGGLTAVKFFIVPTDRATLRWTRSGDAFEFVENASEGALIKRQQIADEVEPTVLIELPRTYVVDFIRVPETKDLVISNRKFTQDAVLITNFD